MTFKNLYIVLKQSGIPQKRPKAINIKLLPPYLVVCEGTSEFNGADEKILVKEHNPRIELYTKANDYTSYDTLCTVLNNNNLPFSVSDEIQISDEGIFVRYFDIYKQIDLI